MGPRVSVGVPVFNGERYLETTLDSILAQTFTDFELVICDNASTDRTREICERFAASDPRVRYKRNPSNLGASPNFNRAFEESCGEYFKWSAYDDVIAPDYLAKCVEVLDGRPDVVLCHARTAAIDPDGRPSLSCPKNFGFDLRLDSTRPHQRFGDIINQRKPSWVFIFGLMRRSALQRTRLFGSYHSADRNLLSEMALLGKLYEVPETLFFWRSHPLAYTDHAFVDAARQSEWWHRGTRIRLPHLRILWEYRNSVRKVPLGAGMRWLCYAQIGRWLAREGWFRIGRDAWWHFAGRKASPPPRASTPRESTPPVEDVAEVLETQGVDR